MTTTATAQAPIDSLKGKMAAALHTPSFKPLESHAKEQLHSLLVDAGLGVTLEVGKEVIEVLSTEDNGQAPKPSHAYIYRAKAAMEEAIPAGVVAQQYALAIAYIEEIADRLAAIEHIPFPAALLPAVLDTGIDGDTALVSPDGSHGSLPALIIAQLTGTNLRALAADIWVMSREKDEGMRRVQLKFAGRIHSDSH